MARLKSPAIEAALVALGKEAIFADAATIAATRQPGAYVLLIELDPALGLTFGRTAARLSSGWYAYTGSARGPGGIGARVTWHLASGKRPHWHVDKLTLAGSAIEAIMLPDGRECDLAAALRMSGVFDHVLPGFGSSDCKSCTSHLLAWRGKKSGSPLCD